MSNEANIVEAGTADDWRAWLARNCRSAKEVWLVLHRHDSGTPSLRYHEAVEQALCFGWIDGLHRRCGADSSQTSIHPAQSAQQVESAEPAARGQDDRTRTNDRARPNGYRAGQDGWNLAAPAGRTVLGYPTTYRNSSTAMTPHGRTSRASRHHPNG